MSKLRIENKNYYHGLIFILSVFLVFNIFTSFTTQNIYGLIPITIQSGLFFLLVTKNALSQLALKVWIIIMFFIGQGLKIFGVGLQTLGSYMKNEDSLEILTSYSTIFSFVFIILGIILWILNKNFAVVISEKDN